MYDKFIKYFLLWLTIFLFQLGIWLIRKFGEISFSQFYFHIDMGIEGLIHSDQTYFASFARKCLLVPTVIIIVIQVSFKYYKVSIVDKISKTYLSTILIMSLSLFLHKISFFEAMSSYYDYFKTRDDYFASHYTDPKQVAIQAPKKFKNLILIYVESLEETYANTNLFSHNLISSIQPTAIPNSYHFNQYEQAPATGWTIAGIVSTQCGVPLKTMTHNSVSYNESGFLKGAFCLGDILKNRGYRNIFVNGPDLTFSGLGKFLKTHGYDEAYGREEWYKENKTKDDMNDWGLYDDLLFIEAEKKLDELESHPNTPFNLTLLTIDTHGPNGYVSKHCANQHGVTKGNFEGIVECTALQLRDFIDYVQKKGYLENTLIVVFGDHLAMKNPVYTKLISEKNRHIFNIFINNSNLKKNRDEIVEFDMFPSILTALNFDIEQIKLGLGYSGFGTKINGVNSEYYTKMQEKIMGYSPRYAELWHD
jgi:phosphoglycerol transferase